jgi:hypothetical protein
MTTINRALSAQALRKDGPLVDVTLHAKCKDDTSCPPIRGKGLIDTGADRTAVEFADLDAIDAVSAGTYFAQGVTSEGVSLPTYPLRVELDDANTGVDLERVAATPHLRSQGLVALIGRDVLGAPGVKLQYDGAAGTFMLTTPKGETRVESAPSTVPLAGIGAALALGALAAWLFAPACAECPKTT